jgi:precorrin-6A/cobalt-precorrin-6A reductase
MKLLLLGGTTEARQLAGLLISTEHEVISSLAGRTSDLHLPAGEVRVGGFGGVAGLVDWLRKHQVDAVIDATHPFAATMTQHAVAAARETGVPLLILRRPGWTATPEDNWHSVDTPEAAAELLLTLGSRAFLTIGRQGLDTFASTGLWTLARCVDPPNPVPSWCTLLLARGPYDEAAERDLMRHHAIDVLVSKDSGGSATEAKLTAARRLHLPVILIRRPPHPAGPPVVETPEQALAWLTTPPATRDRSVD